MFGDAEGAVDEGDDGAGDGGGSVPVEAAARAVGAFGEHATGEGDGGDGDGHGDEEDGRPAERADEESAGHDPGGPSEC